MVSLNPKQKRFLRGLAHNLKPVVMIGSAGLTESVLAEINQSIAHHELLKIKISGADKQSRIQMIKDISESTDSTLVFTIGHMATFYKPAKKPQIELPK